MKLVNTKKYVGHCSTLVYEKDHLSFSKGCCNVHANRDVKIINISLYLYAFFMHIDLWEGHRFYDPILRLLDQPVRSHAKLLKQTWKIIAALGDSKKIFEEVFESGRKQGRQEKVKEIRKVLGFEV